MQKIPSFFGPTAILLAVLIMSCGLTVWWFQNSKPSDLCFVLQEGNTSTHLIIRDGEPSGTMTVVERKDGKDVVPPSTGPGNLEENAFVLVDGTTLSFDDTQLVWPEGSLLAGTVFQASECPIY